MGVWVWSVVWAVVRCFRPQPTKRFEDRELRFRALGNALAPPAILVQSIPGLFAVYPRLRPTNLGRG